MKRQAAPAGKRHPILRSSRKKKGRGLRKEYVAAQLPTGGGGGGGESSNSAFESKFAAPIAHYLRNGGREPEYPCKEEGRRSAIAPRGRDDKSMALCLVARGGEKVSASNEEKRREKEGRINRLKAARGAVTIISGKEKEEVAEKKVEDRERRRLRRVCGGRGGFLPWAAGEPVDWRHEHGCLVKRTTFHWGSRKRGKRTGQISNEPPIKGKKRS